MNKRQTILSGQQANLVAELCSTYGIEPDDVVFFTGDPNPLFGYEASCVLLNRLTDIVDRELEPVPPISSDSVARRCRLVFPDGSSSFIGVANIGEKDDKEQELTTSQLEWLADSRAIRGAIRAKGLNLLKLHNAAKYGEQTVNAKPVKSNRVTLLAQVHTLGNEAGLIKQGPGEAFDKSLWYQTLDARYDVGNSNDLSDEQLADFAAYLNSRVQRAKPRPLKKRKAARAVQTVAAFLSLSQGTNPGTEFYAKE
jgi:hypothetical protein